MILSKQNKFIFIHIAKTAGTSVNKALIDYAAPGWQVTLNQAMQRQNISFLYPVPYKNRYSTKERLSKAINIAYRNICIRSVTGPHPYWDHITADNLRKKMDPEAFESYYKFAFVRNPWSRLLSLYTYLLQNHRHPRHRVALEAGGFNGFIQHGYEKLNWQDQIYCLSNSEGELIVDFVGKYENLSEDFRVICDAIGIPMKLPHINQTSHADYREYYSPESIELVAKMCYRDIELFNYSFE